MTNRLRILLGAAAVIAVSAACDEASSPAAPTAVNLAHTMSSGTQSTLLGRANFGDPSQEIFKVKRITGDWHVEVKAKPTLDLAVQRIVFQPGGQSGWHTHPGPVFIQVVAGVVIGVVVEASGPYVNGSFVVMIDGAEPHYVGPGGSNYLSGVSVGEHVVSLQSPRNCSVETESWPVTITTGELVRDTVEVSFSVTSEHPPSGNVRISAPTTGTMSSATPYRVWYEHFGYWDYGGELTYLGDLEPNGSLVVDLPVSNMWSGADPYWFRFYLEDVPSTCRVDHPNPSRGGHDRVWGHARCRIRGAMLAVRGRPPAPAPGSRGRRALARTRSARQRNPQARGAAGRTARLSEVYLPAPGVRASLGGTTQDLPAIIPWWPSATAGRSGSTMRAGRWSGRSRATPPTSSGLSAFARSTTRVPAW